MGEVDHWVKKASGLIVDSSRVWIYSPLEGIQGWDFGVTNSSPVSLSSSFSLNLDGTKEWDVGLSSIRNTVTGQVIFNTGGRYGHPFDVQSGGRYVAICYGSGDILVLDFNHVLP